MTKLRTAAASAVATRTLSRDVPSVLALLGTGAQALAHLAAIREVRQITTVHIWGRSADKAAALAEAITDIPTEVFALAEAAVAKADIVCTLTPASEPILRGAWLWPGTHINAVGACSPTHRELDTEAVRRARVFVDTMEACLKEPGDLVAPISAKQIEPSHLVGEVGAVLSGQLAGRSSVEEITLFKSVGIALEDLTAVLAIKQAAHQMQ